MSLLGTIDKRRGRRDTRKRGPVGRIIFTANAAGTTTTLVGANAAPATDTNVVHLNEMFKLFTAAGVLKEETTFKITAVAVAASTTVTFSPAAAVATASTDVAKIVSVDDYSDSESMDSRLTALDGAYFTAARLRQMNDNDKRNAIRLRSDPNSL